ncbi:hypothetical protein K402DRAFT_405628 [Aulographum hederae CBS 113979]|uniref:Uncharacterized protein n=1 Tax=Aulographum hederae CBS 113979 TaxID=1176131 RepID=A0A6G1GVS4_9PEZI|nr:hypothetical protein K402DRAFT_405628 [Aulographum hederae CBS 113979]
MLDENLPTFYIKPSPDNVKHHQAFYLTQHGQEPQPTYSLRYPDPASPSSRNCYAAALFDSYNPDVLYGEVLIKPEWTQPSLSQDDIRRNGGVPPAPQPILPQEFIIQLYNPDSQIKVTQKAGSWGGTPSYLFSMPQHTFRTPSSSALDRTLNDPTADITTPKINFVWKREGKLSKDMSCFMTGKSTDIASKKKGGKEPDIATAVFKVLREVTIYESNFSRIEIEDYKGLEVVLLLGAAVIRDLYFAGKKDVFNVGDARAAAGRKNSSPMQPSVVLPPIVDGSAPVRPAVVRPAATNAALGGLYPRVHTTTPPSKNDERRRSLPPLNTSPPPRKSQINRPPPTDPRSQWEIDAETARLKAQADAERLAEETRRRERQRADEAERKRIKKMLEAEEKEKRRRQADVDKETQRLRKKYGDQQNLNPGLPLRPQQQQQQQYQQPHPQPQNQYHRPQQYAPQHYARQPNYAAGALPPQRPMQAPAQSRPTPVPQQRPAQGRLPNGLYQQPAQQSASTFFSSSGSASASGQPKPLKSGRSFWGLRGQSETKLTKKGSTMF